MKTRNYILVADREDESVVDYTMEKCGINRFWVPTPFGVRMCDAEATTWMIVKLFFFLGLAWISGQKLKVQMRRAPGE